jgi:outer membrane protein
MFAGLRRLSYNLGTDVCLVRRHTLKTSPATAFIRRSSMKKTRLSALAALVIALPLTLDAHAANLIETFRLAQKNDAQWAARKAKFLADRESVEQAAGTLRPNAQFGVKWAQIQSDAPSGNIDSVAGQDCSDAITTLTTGNQSGDPVEFGDLAGLQSCGTLFSDVVTALSTVERNTNNLMQYNLTGVQPLLRLDRLYTKHSALSLLSAAQADLGAAQQDLMLRTSQAYFNLLKTQEDLRLAQSEERTLKAALAETKNRYKVGLVRDTDVYEIQSSYDLANAAVIIARAEVDSAREMLVMMTNRQEIMIDPLPRDVPIDSPRPLSVAEWEDTAKRNNLTLLAARFVVNSRKKDMAAKRAGHAPTVDLVADYGKATYSGDSESENQTTTIGVNITIPLYTGGVTSSQEKQARHRYDEAEDNADLALRNALRETRQYHTRVNSDVETVRARAAGVRSSASAYRSMKLGYENGVRTLTDVLSSQRTLFQARKDYANARFLYIVNTLQLKKAAGILSENDLEILNSWLAATTPSPVEPEELGGMTMQEIDGINLKADRRAYDESMPRNSHKSLYDAFKSWQDDKQ